MWLFSVTDFSVGVAWKWRERYITCSGIKQTHLIRTALNYLDSRIMWEIWKRFRISLQTGPMKKSKTLKWIATLEPEERIKSDIGAVFVCGQVEQRKNGEQLFSHSTESRNGGGNSQQEEFRLNVRINFLTMRVVKC